MSDAKASADSTLPDSPEALEALIEGRREHLSGVLDELAGRVTPKALAGSAKDAATEKARSLVTDEDGNLLKERVVAIGAAVVALVVTVVVVRSRRSHR